MVQFHQPIIFENWATPTKVGQLYRSSDVGLSNIKVGTVVSPCSQRPANCHTTKQHQKRYYYHYYYKHYPGVPVILDRMERCVLRQQTDCRLMKLYVPTNVGVYAQLDDDN